jgi:hypothetical protein
VRPSTGVNFTLVRKSCKLYLIWTGDDLRELAFLLILTFDDGFDDGGMVGAQVRKDMCDACFPDSLEEGERRRVPRSTLADWVAIALWDAYIVLTMELSSFEGCNVNYVGKGGTRGELGVK